MDTNLNLKTIPTTILFLILTAAVATAQPFLVCDPYPAENQPTQFIVKVDQSETVTDYSEITTSAGERVAVVVDLAGYPDGLHKITVRAKNIWGESAPAPFEFNKQPPNPITNIRIRNPGNG